ncbi:MAG: DUF2442 domain-containing protein [Acidobacteria bacterium]|nr:DUF2442 domain-containing protein [Acidobacteriota bacterium]
MEKEKFNQQYDSAVKAGKRAQQTESRAVAAHYDKANNRLIVELQSGVILIVPCTLIQGLGKAKPEQIEEVKVMPRGAALHWDNLDVQMSVPGLIAGIFGTRRWMAELGRQGGRATSEAKRAAVRENGKKGGRPRAKERGKKAS